MSEADDAFNRAVFEAYNERYFQAGLIAMAELKSELPRVITFADFEAWCAKVNELAAKIAQRPN